jgi:uroporphyrinogen-III decarboxylase
MKDRKFIFNVGHGLTPECRIGSVKQVIEIVKEFEI